MCVIKCSINSPGRVNNVQIKSSTDEAPAVANNCSGSTPVPYLPSRKPAGDRRKQPSPASRTYYSMRGGSLVLKIHPRIFAGYQLAADRNQDYPSRDRLHLDGNLFGLSVVQTWGKYKRIRGLMMNSALKQSKSKVDLNWYTIICYHLSTQ